MKLFLTVILAASLAAIAANQIATEPVETTGVARVDTPKGEIFLSIDADGRTVVTTGQLAQDQTRGTFSRVGSVDHSARLAHLAQVNAPPPPPPAPSTVVIVNQTTTVEIERERRRHRRGDMRVDRRIHDRRQRTPRQYYPTPLPSFGIPTNERRER